MAVTFFVPHSPADPVWSKHKLLSVKALVFWHRELSELLTLRTLPFHKSNTSDNFDLLSFLFFLAYIFVLSRGNLGDKRRNIEGNIHNIQLPYNEMYLWLRDLNILFYKYVQFLYSKYRLYHLLSTNYIDNSLSNKHSKFLGLMNRAYMK